MHRLYTKLSAVVLVVTRGQGKNNVSTIWLLKSMELTNMMY